MNKKKSSFSGQLGFVLAAAGSAVGVGNLWRFPYLAAKDGGGLFLVIYLALVLTFGFTLLASDIAIGRRTKESAIGAYTQMSPKWKFLGVLTFLVPVLIMTYYAVIGGWVTKYAVVYLTGQTAAAGAVRPFAPYHPRLRRILRRQRRHRAGLLSAGNKVTIHWIFSENAGTDKFVRPFQAGAETYENGLF